MTSLLRRFGRRQEARPAAPRPVGDWRTTFRRRAVLTALFLGVWAAAIETRLVFLQLVNHAQYVALDEKQRLRTVKLLGKRGDLLDRHGHILATSVEADTIWAVPSELGDLNEAAATLCKALGDCTPKDQQALADRLGKQRSFAYVRRQATPEEAQRVAQLKLPGIGFMKESRRFYPNKELGAHLLGYVGLDGQGLSGLEGAYDSQIRGTPGTMLVQTDARRRAFSRDERPPAVGASVELTIDEYLQHVAERELHQGVLDNKAAGGTAIVLDPHTGEILAMANEPTFNPNAYREFDDVMRRNRAVQDIYEPGSTFKVVTASAAIEEQVLPLDALIDTNPGQIHIGSRVVKEALNHNYGVLSMEDVIVKSSNVGAIKIGFKIGTERLSRYVERYGFGRAVSPDFPGESPGIVWNPAKWTDSALASVSMGYQVGVTPLQMVAAISSVANGGEMMQPRVVRAIYRDNRRLAVAPKVIRRTIEANTATVLTGIMEGVVERGTAKAAQIQGFTIAGKTGTAAKLIGGRYSTRDYNASFVGFAPSRNPAVTILVVIDSPHAGPTTGGAVSAPVWRRIAEATLRYMGVAPNINPTPPVLVTTVAGGSENVSGPETAPSPTVHVVSDGPADAVPDLKGLSARDAVRQLVKLGLMAQVSGDGMVVAQDPPAGAPIEPGTTCHLTLARSPQRRASGNTAHP